MMSKFGAGTLTAAASIAAVDPVSAVSYVNQFGVVGILVIVALALWVKSERQEKRGDELREAKAARERERDEKLNATLNNLNATIAALKQHCEDRNG